LQTELVIQKAQEINESLRSEIDKYENETIETFKRTKFEREQGNTKLIDKVKMFLTNNSQHLNEFKIDDNVVESSLTGAGKIIQYLKLKDTWSMVETRFNRIKFGQLNLSVIRDFKSHLNLIGVGDGEYKAFYINKDCMLSFVTLDKLSAENSTYYTPILCCNAKISMLGVVRCRDTLIVGFSLIHPNQSFCFTNRKFSAENKHHYLFKINRDPSKMTYVICRRAFNLFYGGKQIIFTYHRIRQWYVCWLLII
jgi:hypothetical protein